MAERIIIGQCPVDCLSMAETVGRLERAVAKKQRTFVAPVNAATVVDAGQDMAFRTALNEMDILLPDGFYLQAAAKLLSYPSPGHVATVPLVFELLQRLSARKSRVYILGAQQEIAEKAGHAITSRFSGIQVAGAHNGYFTQSQEAWLVEEINNLEPDVLLLGISAPKRELFLSRWRDSLKIPACIGVGGLIDILGGKTPEGPQFLRNYGMMWLYRLLQEPRRLWKRYTITNTKFALLVIQQAMRVRFSHERKDLA